MKLKKMIKSKRSTRASAQQKSGLFSQKRSMETEMLGWIILGVIVLILVVIGIIILTGKGTGAIAYIKNLFRFRS